jgi:hypothetical protein
VRGLQTIAPAYFCRPDPGSPNPAPETKSLLVLFFRKEQNLLLSYEKEARHVTLADVNVFLPLFLPKRRLCSI